MSDGGEFRTAPTAERVLGRRTQPLATKLVAIVAVTLIAAFGTSIAIAYPFVHSSAIELSRAALSNQADAVARFVEGAAIASGSAPTLPNEILDILENHHVKAVLVAPTDAVVAPMVDADRTMYGVHAAVSDIRTEGDDSMLYEFRLLNGGYSLMILEPQSIADEPTRKLLFKMIFGAVAALVLSMALVMLYAGRITSPLKDAVEAAERMAEGSRDVRLPEAGAGELVDLSRSMNDLSDALANSEDRQRQFLLSVSHELRTPLTAIAGYAEALADGVIPPEDMQDVGSVVQSESVRLQRLVSDLLDLGRAGAIELRLDPQRIDLRDLVTEAAHVWRDRCEREGVEFRLELHDEASLLITTDAVRVRQIIDNLCENALRVTPAGRPLILAARSAKDVVEIEVRDGGPGLSEDDVAVAFEPAALFGRYIGIRPVGTGIGLALVGRLAARLGGTATAGAAGEGGARFTVTLPSNWVA